MNGPSLRGTLRNILIVARREFVWRARTRTFVITTIFLAVVATAVALAPVIVRIINQADTGDRIGVYASSTTVGVEPVGALQALLRPVGDTTGTAVGALGGDIVVESVATVSAGRADVASGRLKALLTLDRGASGDLSFTLYSKMAAYERTAQLIQQAATALALTDRLAQKGILPSDQAALFRPPSFDFKTVNSTGSTETANSASAEQFIGGSIIGFAFTITIFISIMLYGQWVAMSVAEEKSSRVMELVIGAAKPFELMTGKVIGVGAVGLLQFAIVFIPTALAIVFQDRIAALILGGSASTDLPSGLTVPLLGAFGLFFVLGFGVYAALYAAAGSLVSRQEDINQIVGPLTMLSMAGYLIAVYTSTGLLDLGSSVVQILSFIPFLSPYIMLSRMTAGPVATWEPVLAILLLVATLVAALWIAGRVYAAGVLMYGQKPGLRIFVQALRGR